MTARNLLLLLILLMVFACKQDQLSTPTQNLERGLPDETSLNVRLSEYTNERLDYVIEAQRMERFTDRRLLYGYKVTLTSYDRFGVISSVVRADTTIVDDARNIIFANGNASFETPDGNLKTSKMVWERNLDELSAPGYVVLSRSGDILRGTNLRTNAKFSYATLDAVSAEGIIDEADFDW